MQELGIFRTFWLADEYLAFTTESKEQWSTSGTALVKSMLNKYQGEEEKMSREDRPETELKRSLINTVQYAFKYS
jgi:hypothetical protein